MYTQLIEIIALLWAGMIIGISFLESWVKFRAHSLTKPVGLDVGRVVFRLFHKIQSVLLILIICISFVAQLTFKDWVFLCGLVLILSIQMLWLFPQLNNRVDTILTGGHPPSSLVHAGYGVTELAKLILLLTFSVKLILL